MPWFGILGSLFTAKGTQSNVFMVLSNNNNINEANNEDCIVKIHRWANKSFLINHLIFNTLIKPVHQGQTDKDSSVIIFLMFQMSHFSIIVWNSDNKVGNN